MVGSLNLHSPNRRIRRFQLRSPLLLVAPILIMTSCLPLPLHRPTLLWNDQGIAISTWKAFSIAVPSDSYPHFQWRVATIDSDVVEFKEKRIGHSIGVGNRRLTTEYMSFYAGHCDTCVMVVKLEYASSTAVSHSKVYLVSVSKDRAYDYVDIIPSR